MRRRLTGERRRFLDCCAPCNGSRCANCKLQIPTIACRNTLAECFIKAGRIRMPADAADFRSLRFSTRGLPERMRVPMWREEFGRRIVHVDIEPLSNVPFQAEATLQALP